jgi:RsiW-degrading membrane proteinase PrsW (M82 family)
VGSDLSLFAVCAASGTAWATLAAWRSPDGSARATARALLGGGAAFGIALCAYGLLEAQGVEVRWDRVLGGGWRAVLLATVIGAVEEGAKLAGIALAVVRPERPGVVMRTTVGVSAAFAALEAALVHSSMSAPVALTRALLAPVAHAILAAPVGFALATVARGRPALWLAPGLLASAALHAAADLSLAAPRYGRVGYFAALLAPAIAVYLHARGLVRVEARLPPPGLTGAPAARQRGFVR